MSRHGVKWVVLSAMFVATLGVLSRGVAAQNQNQNGDQSLRAVPFVFIGSTAECVGAAGSQIVTPAWLGGHVLPDNGGSNTTAVDLTPPAANRNANQDDPHRGLLLSKNGPTADCSAAGATIEGFRRNSTLTELGFDYPNGTHCCAGAPRFNISTADGLTSFAGCPAITQTPAP